MHQLPCPVCGKRAIGDDLEVNTGTEADPHSEARPDVLKVSCPGPCHDFWITDDALKALAKWEHSDKQLLCQLLQECHTGAKGTPLIWTGWEGGLDRELLSAAEGPTVKLSDIRPPRKAD